VKPSFEALLEPICQEMDVELLAVKLHGSGSSRNTLRVTIDRAGGVSSIILESISRALSLQLDAHDIIANVYTLEVSSPGLDWPLTTEQDFRRYLGDFIHVHMQDGQTFQGECQAVDSAIVQLQDSKGKQHSLPIQSMMKAVRAINWKKKNKQKRVFS